MDNFGLGEFGIISQVVCINYGEMCSNLVSLLKSGFPEAMLAGEANGYGFA
jgi:hypothetical protein